jgi:hypothetical protein
VVKVEPSAEIRQGAAQMWQYYTAFVDVGFTEPQALSILGTIMQAMIAGGIGGGDSGK